MQPKRAAEGRRMRAPSGALARTAPLDRSLCAVRLARPAVPPSGHTWGLEVLVILQASDQIHDPSPRFHPHCLWIRCLGILCMKRSDQFGRCILECGVHERPHVGTFTPSLHAQSPGLGDRVVLLV